MRVLLMLLLTVAVFALLAWRLPSVHFLGMLPVN